MNVKLKTIHSIFNSIHQLSMTHLNHPQSHMDSYMAIISVLICLHVEGKPADTS